MTARGQQRHLGRRARHFRSTPMSGPSQDLPALRIRAKPGAADTRHAKKKPPEGGSSISNLMITDQAATKAGFDFRR